MRKIPKPKISGLFKKSIENQSNTIIDRIKTFEDACDELGINPENVFNINDELDEIAYKKLKIIVRALNDGWIPDWNDNNQRKWIPWFIWDPLSSGFGFDDSYYSYSFTGTGTGSRLCFSSDALSNYAGQQFIELYNEYLK